MEQDEPMRRKVEYVYAGNNGKPVYVEAYLTDEGPVRPPGTWVLEVVSSQPEPRPKPGAYRPRELPGGWVRLVPDPATTREEDVTIEQAARSAGFVVKA